MLEINGRMYEPGQVIALVGCGKQKREAGKEYYAKDLYTSSYFSLKRRNSETYADRWYILSAKHGLINPHLPIRPYDVSMRDLGPVETEEWAKRVVSDLFARGVEFEDSGAEALAVFAGKDYYEPILRELDRREEEFPLPVVLPFDGLGFHEQMAYLSEQLPDEE